MNGTVSQKDIISQQDLFSRWCDDAPEPELGRQFVQYTMNEIVPKIDAGPVNGAAGRTA